MKKVKLVKPADAVNFDNWMDLYREAAGGRCGMVCGMEW